MEIQDKIKDKLKEIEKIYGIKIIFAVESGSRAWGFESKDSDYDIRCVHVYNKDRYLQMNNPSEHIEVLKDISDGLDIVSWDIKKFMKLFCKSNPSVCEWSNSDIIYKNDWRREQFKDLFDNAFNKVELMKHYHGMAKQNYHKYIDKNKQIELKKYVYVLRALGCYLWILNEETVPPLNYKQSMIYLPKEIQNYFNDIVKLKQSSEINKGERNEKMDRWIELILSKQINKSESLLTFNIKYLNDLTKEVIEENDF